MTEILCLVALLLTFIGVFLICCAANALADVAEKIDWRD